MLKFTWWYLNIYVNLMNSGNMSTEVEGCYEMSPIMESPSHGCEEHLKESIEVSTSHPPFYKE